MFSSHPSLSHGAGTTLPSSQSHSTGSIPVFSCPNPACNFILASHDNICDHLLVPRSLCTVWAMNMVNSILRGNLDVKDDSHMPLHKLNNLTDMITDDDLPSLVPIAHSTSDNLQTLLPAPAHPSSVTTIPPQVSLQGLTKTYHPNPSIGITGGRNLPQ